VGGGHQQQNPYNLHHSPLHLAFHDGWVAGIQSLDPRVVMEMASTYTARLNHQLNCQFHLRNRP
jgi:hypothetical protein